MNLNVVAEFIINTLSLGSLYALISLGLVFVYGIMQLVNFAYGEFIMVPCYVLYLLGVFTTIPWPIVSVVAILAGVVIGFLSEIIAFRPFRGRSLDALLVSSFAVSMILQYGFQLAVSPRSKAIPFPAFFRANMSVAGMVIPLRNIIMIVTTALLLVCFTLLMRKTVLGIAMRAASENFITARLMGVPANLVISVAFIISGGLAGVVAIFWGARSGAVEPMMGAAPLLVGFIAVVIGGMHSLPGSVVGGFVYAAIANILSLTLPSSMLSFRDAFMFVIVILFLVLKPEGLIRGAYREERVG
ncbi:MAG: branched-chain amino acid ABC transporter permease [Actinomycetes bacterium]|nr:branched-chain amino acid ABC transporter permease [Actinomycetes bacterium]